MESLSRKIHLLLPPPTEADARSDAQRICDALPKSVRPVSIPLSVMRSFYPLLPDSGWDVTATLSFRGNDFELIRLEAGDTTARHFGVAVDLGSTTVCMKLVDLNTGAVLAFDSEYNGQIAFGEDILTRVFYSKDQPEHLKEIHDATISTFLLLLDRLTEQSGIPTDEITAMVVSGNTTMLHFFLGLDGFAVFSTPYAPHATKFDFIPAADLGLPQRGYVYCVPCRANYLGGDILSGMAATGIPERDEISVFLDIGTNGELVVGNRHFLLTGAGAAGPALEGGVVKTGMRAVPGAVSAVALRDGVFSVETIENAPPKGICGSGIVDLIAALLLNAVVDFRGMFREEHPLVAAHDGELSVCYAPGLRFYQSDLNAFLRTKSAANTMVGYILDYAGIPMEEVSRFYVAGAFGTHLDKESAVTIGLYPDLPRDHIINAGNSSLEGAVKILCDRKWIRRFDQILEQMEYIQFGAVTDFVSRMTAAMALPHTNMNLYPSVRKKLAAHGIMR